MSTLAEFMIVAGADNRPPMLDKAMYESWKSRMELYIQGMDHGRIILNSVENGPLIWPTVEQEDGTQERECKLYDEFDKFSHVKGETLLPPEWGKFVTDVMLARDVHTSNYDQLYAYLEQHEAHANEAHFMRERFPDPFAVSNPYEAPHHPQQHPNTYPTTLDHTQPSVPQNAYPPPTIPQQPQAEFPQLDSGLSILTFLPSDDPIAYMNKAMVFLSAVFSPRYPSTNNQLRSSSSPRNQAAVQDGEGHMARQCTQPKRRRDATWFKEKVLLVQAHAESKELDEEQLAFLADPGVADGQVA
ncbi:hypothetical protein Tco_0927060 [Tanacetum coccineum]|uniref:Integrase, catalytic region, zinc finger, CCHC-type, peptidase aspartic, catalytic n=1 Tax=Tanacetum coccineum TaxID=301880 RepID=A0ABQ5DBL7_9ASTR